MIIIIKKDKYIDIILYHIILYYIVLYCIISYYIILYYIILYYIILYYIILYYIILYYIILYYIIFILYYIILYYIILYYIILYYIIIILYYIILYYIILYYIILYYIILYYIILYYIILYYIILYYIILYYIILYYIILYYIILYYIILYYIILYYIILLLYYIILSYLILSYLILSYLILSYLILSYLILSYLILSYLILSYLILSYLILSYLILYYLILYYIILYYIILYYIILYYIILYYIYLSIIFTVPYFTRESCHLGHPPSFGHTNLRDEGCDPKLQLSPTPSAVSYCEDIHALQLKTRWRAACGEFLGESKLTWSRCIKYVSNIRLKVHMNELWLKAICAEEVRNVQIQGAHSPWTTAKTCKVSFQKLLDHAWSLSLYRSSSEQFYVVQRRWKMEVHPNSNKPWFCWHSFRKSRRHGTRLRACGLLPMWWFCCLRIQEMEHQLSIKPVRETSHWYGLENGVPNKQLVICMKKTRWHTHNSRWSNLP